MELGQTIRRRRQELGLTLRVLGERAGCAASYLSQIESGKRAGVPSDAVLLGLESALGLKAGTLIRAARWEETPGAVRREVGEMVEAREAALELAALLRGGVDERGRPTGALDAAYKSGALRRLIDRVAPEPSGAREGARGKEGGEEGGGEGGGMLGGVVPMRVAGVRVPLINKVAAGYPREFTDLGYPARVADEYLSVPDLDDPDAFAARVVGDSMLPEYREGDVVVFSPTRPIRSGMDCFARIEPDHETTFKRVYLESGPGGAEVIRLQPLNPAYAARVVERERVAGLYAAVSVTRRV
ncbi:MAG: LexA family transcriptional regulator [Phycisphaerae bacterium]|nr:LexA family transcriptional regulator [Phycisphaerae bacterium]